MGIYIALIYKKTLPYFLIQCLYTQEDTIKILNMKIRVCLFTLPCKYDRLISTCLATWIAQSV